MSGQSGNRWRLRRQLGGPGEPWLHLDLIDLRGEPRVERVEVRAAEHGRRVTDADLRAVHLATEVAHAVQIVAVFDPGDTPPRMADAVSRATRAGYPTAGKAVGREHLTAVAEVYATAEPDRGTRAVEDTWQVPQRTASRWVQQARAAGILPPARGAAK